MSGDHVIELRRAIEDILKDGSQVGDIGFDHGAARGKPLPEKEVADEEEFFFGN